MNASDTLKEAGCWQLTACQYRAMDSDVWVGIGECHKVLRNCCRVEGPRFLLLNARTDREQWMQTRGADSKGSVETTIVQLKQNLNRNFRKAEVIHSASKYAPSYICDCLNYKEHILSAPLGGTQMKSQCKFTPVCARLPTFLHRNLSNQKYGKLMCCKKTEKFPRHVEAASSTEN